MEHEKRSEEEISTGERASVDDSRHLKQTQRIRAVIQQAEKQARASTILYREGTIQDYMGLFILLASFTGMLFSVYAYIYSLLPVAVIFVFSAVCASLLHELEHDTIHNLYFTKQPYMQHFMFFIIWISKFSLNPWTRKEYHLQHHRRSGQADDIEERLLGLGIGNLIVRLAVAFFPGVSVFWIRDIQRDAPTKYHIMRGGFWSLERQVQRIDLLFISCPGPLAIAAYFGYYWAAVLFYCWVGPNMLRHACLNLLSSYSHYYGIPPGDVFYQNQILRHWSLMPMQLFCFNFGAEHIIHHYVVDQPFYVRHAVRHEAWKILEELGTPVNDFGIVLRANRYPEPSQKKSI